MTMWGLVASIAELTVDVATVVAKPVEIAVNLTGAAVKPIANMASAIADEVKDFKDGI